MMCNFSQKSYLRKSRHLCPFIYQRGLFLAGDIMIEFYFLPCDFCPFSNFSATSTYSFFNQRTRESDNKCYLKKQVNEVPQESGRQEGRGERLLVSERLEAGEERISNEAKSPGNVPEGAVITIRI